mmetsp:Transcript_6203/g.7077  ORF Transcript_6203/g.7077 Transcript_6203/m.7077 type:complete len:154 (-) Transcript_6203:162-623(-)
MSNDSFGKGTIPSTFCRSMWKDGTLMFSLVRAPSWTRRTTLNSNTTLRGVGKTSTSKTLSCCLMEKDLCATGRQQKDSGVSPAAISNSTTTGMAGPTLLACTRPKVGCISEWKSSSWKHSRCGSSSSSRNNVVLVLESGVHGPDQSESSHMDY